MEEAGALLSAAIGLAMLSALTHFIRNAAAEGTLERNGAIGLRTRVTRSSDAAWRAGHRAAGPWLLACAVTGYAMAAGTAAGAVAAMSGGSVHPAFWTCPATGFVAVVALLIAATAVADRHGGGAAER
ncbi:SdpI family protein [Streptomyces radicis]|uniref:SdpI family protein n=1 Tax=Streptomyces radicis TaxID=1750517 RepID=A0A3A9VVQ1_9ACTN|nr:SdpI family protein [Streptomyces radicis]RKN04612.1 SdpI family protein [Streptomyces radicis]RKN15570.1 SdpI family protein [Streptomyces radicis]